MYISWVRPKWSVSNEISNSKDIGKIKSVLLPKNIYKSETGDIMFLDVTFSAGSGVFNRRKSISAKCVLDITLNPGLTGASLDRVEQFDKVFKKRNRRRKSSEHMQLKKLAKRNATCLSNLHHSLAAIEIEASTRLSTTCIADDASDNDDEGVGYISSWAVSFDKLLLCGGGLSVFTEFLKKEFSEENILFWRTCEQYKSICDPDQRKAAAKDIYNKYVAEIALDAVNIDHSARQQVESELPTPSVFTFDQPQQDIYRLMKTDSYTRFLKSELYKTYLMREMNNEPLGLPRDDFQGILGNKDKKKTTKGKGKDAEDSSKSKKRLSLLPWKQKAMKPAVKAKSDSDLKKNNCSSLTNKLTSDSDLKTHRCISASCGSVNTDVNNMTSTRPGLAIDLETIHKEIKANSKEIANDNEDDFHFCRVILPDGSTTVVSTKPGLTIATVLGQLCTKRSIPFKAIDVCLVGSSEPLDLTLDISTLASLEITIDRRVMFCVELPNGKSIGVKVKPHRSIGEVLTPVLKKHDVKLNQVCVQMSGQKRVLDINLDARVSTIDNRCLLLKQDTTPRQRRRSSVPAFISGRKENRSGHPEGKTLLESEV
ncbi:regulator of G-protein signaling loco-like [Mizuhopecten yessoensis]|uniref:regulator of G-protein signaling loco-like n=1 Tax=Mizuhopecten yessoensis TaxID=6573 RepID=UPI000B45F23B|nr:regulator of G-protein signaling loco-like [Mizuhopecten yessoensis]